MRTIMPVLIVFSIAVAGGIVAGSGFGDAWGADPPQTAAAQSQLNQSASQVNPNDQPISGPVSSGESDIVGLIANGLGTIVDVGAAVVLLPITLVQLGFPKWFSYPLGSLAYVLVGIGVIEWAANREWS